MAVNTDDVNASPHDNYLLTLQSAILFNREAWFGFRDVVWEEKIHMTLLEGENLACDNHMPIM